MQHARANINHHRTHDERKLTGVPEGFVLLIFSTYFALEVTYVIDIVSVFMVSYIVGIV